MTAPLITKPCSHNGHTGPCDSCPNPQECPIVNPLYNCLRCREAFSTPEQAMACDCKDHAYNMLQSESERQLTQVILGEFGEMD